ncbi:E3 ubiquitin-protein ligase synoviolin [Fistulifera solaris]|uniref:RING-type E3 ubiquitin transferase n=1 Tax=Fistulifera solaris TaxID=1519565 RepID=A0A1Z5JR48_FISSO|nr:E3 ubiquitin-protein ligase synoviolin [Fistulifera solaris]|eukprot:GAX16494.1 E3 ubiquitin-protein ligase synoviolin [Fistulifera solaris]
MSAEIEDLVNEEARRQREREEEMERMLLAQEQDQEETMNPPQEEEPPLPELNEQPILQETSHSPPKISYRQASFMAAAALIFHAFRSREQYYLAAVYLSSSKWAYVILGNALIASLAAVFDGFTAVFLSGLRLQEAEGLQDYFRWNLTETCIALTMFRAELSLSTAIEFLILILVKCLHQVAMMREQLLRVTEDAVIPFSDHGVLASIPVIRRGHAKLFVFLLLLQLLDLWVVQRAVAILIQKGPSVNILFAFEAAISLVSAWSHLLLWTLHVLDGLLHYGHDQLQSIFFRHILHPWREYKATLTFAVELQAQAIQFLFYLTFFSIVLTYYGMPINLFREVYVSFSALRERLNAFFKYRRLMANMNRFAAASDEELEEQGSVCIICRDEMTVRDCKRLPGCRHIFHKSCLREWLVQQQSCPTCRTDISTMQAQEGAANAAQQRGEDQVIAEADDSHGMQNATDVEQEVFSTNNVDTQQQNKNQSDAIPEKHNDAGLTKTKTIRFAATLESTAIPSDRTVTLLRVSCPLGAPVTRSDGSFVRFIPSGLLVLGFPERMSRHGLQLVKIADGWIPESTVDQLSEIERPDC